MFDAFDQPPPVHILYPRPTPPSNIHTYSSSCSSAKLQYCYGHNLHCYCCKQSGHMVVLVILSHVAKVLIESFLLSKRNFKLLSKIKLKT